ncbi:MAG: hypothetical protein ACLGG1_09480, partial [Gammaproteobacteria bacterium]
GRRTYRVWNNHPLQQENGIGAIRGRSKMDRFAAVSAESEGCLNARFSEGIYRFQGDELTIPRRQRRPPAATLAAIAAKYPERDDAVVAAYGTGSYSYRQLTEHFGVHRATVGRIVRSRLPQGEN